MLIKPLTCIFYSYLFLILCQWPLSLAGSMVAMHFGEGCLFSEEKGRETIVTENT